VSTPGSPLAPASSDAFAILLRASAWCFFLTLPLAHAFALNSWATVPNVFAVLCLAAVPLLWRQRMQWGLRDRILIAVIALALVATLMNPDLQTDKSRNHVVALLFVVLVNYFVASRYGLVAGEAGWRSAICIGLAGASLLCIVEYALVNVAQVAFELPRPSVTDYEPSFIFGTRARSTFSESGHFAFFLATIGPIAMTVLKQNGHRFTFLAMGVLIAVSAMLAFSTTLFIVCVLWLCLWATMQFAGRQLAGLAVALGLAAVAVYLSAFDIVRDVLEAALVSKFDTGSYTGRLTTIASSASVIATASESDVLFGHGMGSYAGLHILPAISAFANFTRDIGVLGCLLVILALIPYESALAHVPRPWRTCFLYVAVANVVFLAAIPDYYFPHFAFVLGLMSHMGARHARSAGT
jgi:hypothetical protein